jgi:hypothetical protein
MGSFVIASGSCALPDRGPVYCFVIVTSCDVCVEGFFRMCWCVVNL